MRKTKFDINIYLYQTIKLYHLYAMDVRIISFFLCKSLLGQLTRLKNVDDSIISGISLTCLKSTQNGT